MRNQHVTLSKEMFVSKLRSVLYVPQFVSVFPLIVQRAYAGDWSAYAAVVMQLASLLDGAVARGASFAAICAEDVPAITPALVRAATAGTDLGDSQARRYEEYCKAWGTAGSVPKGFYEPVRSKVPALLIPGALDPGTPPALRKQRRSSCRTAGSSRSEGRTRTGPRAWTDSSRSSLSAGRRRIRRILRRPDLTCRGSW